MTAIPFKRSDGGRALSGFRGTAGDCVTRAVAIASGRPYLEIYNRLSDGMRSQRRSKRGRPGVSARDGVSTSRKWFKDYMTELGAVWTPTMAIGTGCIVHVREGELPPGRLVLNLSRHCAAVVDGVLFDLSDCSRDGTRCVYGYWRFPEPA